MIPPETGMFMLFRLEPPATLRDRLTIRQVPGRFSV